MNKLYSTHCPQCNALETKLKRAGIKFEICDDLETITARGFKSAPMLETDEGLFNFSQALKWLRSKNEH